MAALAHRTTLTVPSNYEVRNGRGVTIYTTNDASLARRWARSRPDLGDLIIEEVTLVEVRKRVTTVRPKLAVVQS